MKAEVIKATMVDGQPAPVGKILDIDENLFRFLSNNGQVKLYQEPEPEPEPEPVAKKKTARKKRST